jgi:hypothetical protein
MKREDHPFIRRRQNATQIVSGKGFDHRSGNVATQLLLVGFAPARYKKSPETGSGQAV